MPFFSSSFFAGFLWLNGKITGKELRLLHPLEYQKVLEERQKQKSEQAL